MAGAFCFPVAGAVSFFLGFPSAVCAQFCFPLCIPCFCPRELCTNCAPQPAGNWQGCEGCVRDSGTPRLQLLDRDDLHNTLAFLLFTEWGWPRMLVKFQRTFLIFFKFPVSLWESVFFFSPLGESRYSHTSTAFLVSLVRVFLSSAYHGFRSWTQTLREVCVISIVTSVLFCKLYSLNVSQAGVLDLFTVWCWDYDLPFQSLHSICLKSGRDLSLRGCCVKTIYIE